MFSGKWSLGSESCFLTKSSLGTRVADPDPDLYGFVYILDAVSMQLRVLCTNSDYNSNFFFI
jgi:hypothetical protein